MWVPQNKFREKEGAKSLAELVSITLTHYIEVWKQDKGKDK